uniref:Cytochrome c oxidase subunit 3 n=1 Tax=Amblyomma fimbriatum TaxID=65641 RepID=H9M766_9ACAR|nr:cytochrome c oxidase subunit III [Amblyomma fimbriatum]AET63083.1 cytochrome c oxidase subunit 3 [Amblyomma fimbriatum]
MMFHTFHMVTKSPWPLTSSISALSLTLGFVIYFNFNDKTLILISFLILFLSSFQWWRDISREASLQGNHTIFVIRGLKLGMLLFILSEVFFFLSFFWAFFHSMLAPSIEIGSNWPPKSISPFNPFEVPLLNSTILISSGISITWSHHLIMKGNYKNSLLSLAITIMLGISFTFFQLFEYYQAQFSITDGIFGSTFFLTTGFHGIHVIIGTIFLITSFLRLKKSLMLQNHHFGFEASAWYWHFVDVVWLFLFTFMYWWIF